VAANPLRIAHADALRRALWLRWAFGHYLGSTRHPRGTLLRIYRQARREMREVLRAQRPTMHVEVLEILQTLREQLEAAIIAAGNAAAGQGRQSAERQLQAYRDDGVRYAPYPVAVDVRPHIAATTLELDRQSAMVLSVIERGGDVAAEVAGDDSRMGILQPAPVATTAARALATALGAGFLAGLGARGQAAEFGWRKQTIPSVDEFTTDCCLAAAGQTRPIDEPFHLTATPRFADHLQWTPFHHYCRTSVALYLPTYDDELTSLLRDDVQRERARRSAEAK
jgi:hypothetical protein